MSAWWGHSRLGCWVSKALSPGQTSSIPFLGLSTWRRECRGPFCSAQLLVYHSIFTPSILPIGWVSSQTFGLCLFSKGPNQDSAFWLRTSHLLPEALSSEWMFTAGRMFRRKGNRRGRNQNNTSCLFPVPVFVEHLCS